MGHEQGDRRYPESPDTGTRRPRRSFAGPRREMRMPRRELLTRLIGMETEYAALIGDDENVDAEPLPIPHRVYQEICRTVRNDQPTVTGLFDEEQFFLANGGAIALESDPLGNASRGALVEFATPEVHSPEELLACQRSLDRLASEAAADCRGQFDVRILKNSVDARGHVYGCQENYETEVATGLWLWIYRAWMLLLWFMQIMTLLVSLPVMTMVLFFFALRQRLRFQNEPRESPRDLFASIPPWVTNHLVVFLRLLHWPTVITLRFVARHVAFRRQRKVLIGFLASRVAICGAGNLEQDGCYRMSAKAMAIDTLADMGGYRGEHPVFVYGHWLGQFCAKSFVSLASAREMFKARQRLQIGLSDSNLSELAEYVKIGATSLLLDMVESGHTQGLPKLKRPLRSLHRLAADWNLIARVPTDYGQMSAIELQQAYLRAAELFVSQTPDQMKGESELVLARWRELLQGVVAYREDAHNIRQALGRVDWLTKRWMIDQLGSRVEWSARKKVDLRYHELSSDGYFARFLQGRPDLRLVGEDHIERRRRSPPPDSPAAKRGWLIREFANSDEVMQSEWSFAMIGQGSERRRVEFV